jgi:hypothetical protein
MKGGEFTRHRPARYLSEKTAGPVAALPVKVSPATLDRFEEAFKALNGLL